MRILTLPARDGHGEGVHVALADAVGGAGGGGGGADRDGGGGHRVAQHERLEVEPQLTHVRGALADGELAGGAHGAGGGGEVCEVLGDGAAVTRLLEDAAHAEGGCAAAAGRAAAVRRVDISTICPPPPLPVGGALRAGVARPVSPGRGGGAGRVGELDTMRT